METDRRDDEELLDLGQATEVTQGNGGLQFDVIGPSRVTGADND